MGYSRDAQLREDHFAMNDLLNPRRLRARKRNAKLACDGLENMKERMLCDAPDA